MTITIDSNSPLDQDRFIKSLDATAKQQHVDDIDDIIEVVNELISALSHIREEEKADFSHHDALRKKIDLLFDKNPRAFGYEKTYNWNTQEERDSFILVLKDQFTLPSTEVPGGKKKNIPLEQFFRTPLTAPEKPARKPFELESTKSLPAQDVPTITPAENRTVQEPPKKTSFPHKDPLPPPKKIERFKDVNLGLAFIHMQAQAFDITEGRINTLIKQLSHLNEINKDLSDFITALTRCKESGKADFSNDPETRVLIDRLFKVNPKIFGNQQKYAWDSEKQIDVLLSGLDAEVKTKIAEINQVTMFINVRFDERVQYSENARKVLDMLIRHCESIISKYHKT